MTSSMEQCIIHGAGCILIFEYSYFCFQAQANPKGIIALALKEYQMHGIQRSVVKALQHTIQKHPTNYFQLQQAILDIIVENPAEQGMQPNDGSRFTWRILLGLLNTLSFLRGIQWVYLQLPFWQAEFFFAVSAIAFFTLCVEMQHTPAHRRTYRVAAEAQDRFGLWRIQVDWTIGPPPEDASMLEDLTDPPAYTLSSPPPRYESWMTEESAVLRFVDANPGITLVELCLRLDRAFIEAAERIVDSV
ncbi:hypothetical protein J3A83DRAFT_4382067 [Scleroderma citrinum]